MIRFLLKGILRDKSRSILPIIVVCIGVSLTVTLSGYMRGAFRGMIDQNARFQTGHVKLMTKAYNENKDQLPTDLALLEVGALMEDLKRDYPDMLWVMRTRFGGLIDVPDENGETKGQGPASGIALDLLHPETGEINRMNLARSLVSGQLPKKAGEALVGHDFAEKLGVKLGDEVTYFGTTMNGSMTFQNFVVSGTIRFGAAAMDRGAIVVDISDAQLMLDMEDGTAEVLGYFSQNVYDHSKAQLLADGFNEKFAKSEDEFAPVMLTLKEQNNLAEMIDYANATSAIFVMIFVIAMSVVLWNTGLLGGLRRYREFGIRLALGEPKGRIYGSLLVEAFIIGAIGSVIGTLIGLGAVYYLQVYGIDVSEFTKQSTMLMPSVIRAEITPSLFYIGFIPGVLAMLLGNMLSGMGIYKRETARLFKELEV